jgi:hypothetical protein
MVYWVAAMRKVLVMGIQPIERPRVFISYSWDTVEYKDKVASFATKLMGDGIDVLLDQWEMVEGNDLYAFMERSVADPTVTNVLMFLSPQYAERADQRTGGVGAETQIISSQVYGKTDQTKFIPVIFSRDEDGQYSKPAYLMSQLHFDLTDPDKFEEEYRKLVRRLYGHVVYEKPERGQKPVWVDEDSPAAPVTDYVLLDTLKGRQPEQVKIRTFKEALNKAANMLIKWHEDNKVQSLTEAEYLGEFDLTLRLRDGYLHAVRYYPYIGENGAKAVGDSLETLRHELEKDYSIFGSMKRTVAYELFLSIVGMIVANDDYDALSHIINRFYYITDCDSRQRGYTVFWDNNPTVHKSIRKRDGRNYISGIAKILLDRANPELCTREQLIIADGICFNAALIIRDKALNLRWAPKLYVYDTNSAFMRKYSRNLITRSTLPGVARMFGYDSVQDFKERYADYQAEIRNGDYSHFLNFEAPNELPFLPVFVNADALGTRP